MKPDNANNDCHCETEIDKANCGQYCNSRIRESGNNTIPEIIQLNSDYRMNMPYPFSWNMLYNAFRQYADQQTSSLREQLSLKDKELKQVNEFIGDIAKLLGEDNLGLDGITWSIDDFKEAIEGKDKEIEELKKEKDKWFSKYAVTESENAFLKEQNKWSPTKPEWTEDCVLITATWWKDHWEYKLWEVRKMNPEFSNDGWYWGLCESDGEEWGDIADLTADLYRILKPLEGKNEKTTTTINRMA